MSGLKSRNKGKRNEYLLRDYLRQLGWKADRVPSSGAAQGFKGDIKAEKDGKTVLFELKARKDSFAKIYQLYEEHCHLAKDDVISISLPFAENLCLSLSTSLSGAMEGGDFYPVVDAHPLYPKYPKTFKKIANLESLLGECDVLVIKDDRKPFIFIHYR